MFLSFPHRRDYIHLRAAWLPADSDAANLVRNFTEHDGIAAENIISNLLHVRCSALLYRAPRRNVKQEKENKNGNGERVSWLAVMRAMIYWSNCDAALKRFLLFGFSFESLLLWMKSTGRSQYRKNFTYLSTREEEEEKKGGESTEGERERKKKSKKRIRRRQVIF